MTVIFILIHSGVSVLGKNKKNTFNLKKGDLTGSRRTSE